MSSARVELEGRIENHSESTTIDGPVELNRESQLIDNLQISRLDELRRGGAVG